MIGAYQIMLDLIHRIGLDENSVFQRKSLDLQDCRTPHFFHIKAYPAHPLLPGHWPYILIYIPASAGTVLV